MSGRKTLQEKDVDTMNSLRVLETQVLTEFEASTQPTRWLDIAKQHIEQGFMAARRAVAENAVEVDKSE